VLRSLTPADMQGYVAKRLRDTWRKKRVSAETVKKELATLRMTWNWAVNQQRWIAQHRFGAFSSSTKGGRAQDPAYGRPHVVNRGD